MPGELNRNEVIVSRSTIVKRRGNILKLEKFGKTKSWKKVKSDLEIRPTSQFVLSQWEGRYCQQFGPANRAKRKRLESVQPEPDMLPKFFSYFYIVTVSGLSLRRAEYG
jgi:hypothetical protein